MISWAYHSYAALDLPTNRQDGQLPVRSREAGAEAELLAERRDALAERRMVESTPNGLPTDPRVPTIWS